VSRRDWRRPISEARLARANREARLEQLDREAARELGGHDEMTAASGTTPRLPPPIGERAITSESWSDAVVEIRRALESMRTGTVLVFAWRPTRGSRVRIEAHERRLEALVVGVTRQDELMLETLGLDWSGDPQDPAQASWPREPVDAATHRLSALLKYLFDPCQGSDIVFGPPAAR
jgi:hypothetical protein